VLPGSDLLAFAGVEPVVFPVYPVAQHLAEKLHAYTLPRAEENTRVRDLVDLVTVAAVEPVEAGRLRASVAATFAARGSHAVPTRLSALSRRLPRAAWGVLLVRPETPLRWHRELVRRRWAAFGRRRGPGRPPCPRMSAT
jgi:hypothetical protein